MARSDSSPPRRGLERAAAGARAAGAILTAAVLLVAPIVLWAQFGDGQVEHSVAVAILATLMCWCFVTRHEFREAPAVDALTPGLVARPAPAIDRHASRRRSVTATRPSRDVGCHAGGLRERRPSRRRSRP
ncbi:MAG: hypothetical protein QOI73_1387 [Solirubrobacteraceae bacterium]|nr:hypothetical protein [Solirubrobacteraceae bacterium]